MPKESRDKISKSHINYALRNPEKFIKTKGNYRTQRYYYDNIIFDSSWELITYIYFKHKNINIQRCYFSYKYIYDNKEHVYFPDFYLPDTNKLIEVKGREVERDKEKYKSVDRKLIIFYKEDIRKFDAYNKLHISNYDISQYKIKNKPYSKIDIYHFNKQIRKTIKDNEDKELLFHSLYSFNIDFSKFGCWVQLQKYLSFRFNSPQVVSRWFKRTYKKFKNDIRIKDNPYE